MSVRHYDWIAHFGRRMPDKLAVVDLAGERRFPDAQCDIRFSRLAGYCAGKLELPFVSSNAIFSKRHSSVSIQ